MSNSRRDAAFAVMRYLSTRDFAADLIGNVADRAFVQDLVYTTIRRLRPLRRVLGELVRKWPKGELEALLYVGAAQVLYMPEVPDFAAVNETVSAARTCPNPNVAKVTNGVLRNLIRRRAELEGMLAAEPLEVRESFPTELVRRWTAAYGAEATARMCELANRPAETFLARPDGSYTVLERGCRVTEVSGYDRGEFIVQDPATRLAVELLGATAGERVLDACAAPGGKTVQLAWRGAKVTACEVNPRRRRRLEENLKRVGVEATVVGDLGDSALGTFDRVLVDAPCSNTGVLRRRPDARWGWSAEKLASLVALQAEILDRAAVLVKPGGVLVYSTCSVESEENERQVEAFLRRNSSFRCVGTAHSLPFETGNDGAFAAKFTLALTDAL